MNLLLWVMLGAAVLLIRAAITGRSPISVVASVGKGKP